MAHTDGPAYWPRTATLSLSSAAIMVLLAPRGEDGGATPLCEVILPARSLVVFDVAAGSSSCSARTCGGREA